VGIVDKAKNAGQDAKGKTKEAAGKSYGQRPARNRRQGGPVHSRREERRREGQGRLQALTLSTTPGSPATG